MTDWREVESRVFMTTGRRMPVLAVRGEGTRLFDENGKSYLDFFGGPAVQTLGHCHPVLVKAIEEQARTLIHVSNLIYSIPQLQLAELLLENSCFDRIYYPNSGAEANEGAFKLARKWGKERKNGAFEIISANDSFHGRTLTTITSSGTARYATPFAPLPPGFLHVPFDDIEALQAATTPQTCAIILEPVQGEGGVNVPNPSYMKAVRKWCDEQNILLIADEVQTGMCRTGPLFAYQGMDFEPDIMTLAKGMASGVPIGAFLAKEHCAVFTPGDHGSTFGGNPLATAAAYAVTKYLIENDIPSRVDAAYERFRMRIEQAKTRNSHITGLRGKGLLLAVTFDRDFSDRVLAECINLGLIANNVRPNALRITPPLTLSDDEIDEGVAIIEKAVAKVG